MGQESNGKKGKGKPRGKAAQKGSKKTGEYTPKAGKKKQKVKRAQRAAAAQNPKRDIKVNDIVVFKHTFSDGVIKWTEGVILAEKTHGDLEIKLKGINKIIIKKRKNVLTQQHAKDKGVKPGDVVKYNGERGESYPPQKPGDHKGRVTEQLDRFRNQLFKEEPKK